MQIQLFDKTIENILEQLEKLNIFQPETKNAKSEKIGMKYTMEISIINSKNLF